MAERNYYEILGVSSKASAEDIKKAYRKLVRQHHPDVSAEADADAKTSEINLAYNTLKDADKRAEYDAMLANPYARAGNQQSHAGQGFDSSAFEDYFGQQGGAFQGDFRFDDIFSAFGQRGAGSSGPYPGEDQHAELKIDIAAAYTGAERSLSLSTPEFNAQGRATAAQKTLNVTIPKGIMQDQQIRLAGQGSPGRQGGAAGDLYLKIHFRESESLYVRDRKDVYQRINVAPWDAVLGAKTTVRTPDGATLAVALPANSRSGQKIRLKGRGIPAREPGDLYLLVNIALPEASSEADRTAWSQLAEHYSSFHPQS